MRRGKPDDLSTSTRNVNPVSINNFGYLIAYILPGFVTLWGVSYFSETVRLWMGTSRAGAPTVGGFLYVTLGSVGVGLAISAMRWSVIDSIHHWTGIRKPEWDFGELQASIQAFELLVDSHYRYYQFYSNMLVAMIFFYIIERLFGAVGWFTWRDIGFVVAAAILFAGSRDTLRKYYRRAEELLAASSA